jgi:hypothetical protein
MYIKIFHPQPTHTHPAYHHQPVMLWKTKKGAGPSPSTPCHVLRRRPIISKFQQGKAQAHGSSYHHHHHQQSALSTTGAGLAHSTYLVEVV